LRATGDPEIATWADKMLISIGVSFLGPSILHMVLVVTGFNMKDRAPIFLFLLYGPAIAVSMIRTSSDLITTGVELMYWGYYGKNGPLMTVYLLFIAVYFMTALGITLAKIEKSEKSEREKLWLLFFAVLIPFMVGMTMDGILPQAGIFLPEVSITSGIALILLLAVSIKRYQAIFVTPVKEKIKKHAEKKSETLLPMLERGRMYYLSESKPNLSLDIFRKQVGAGSHGLAITRIHPKRFREMTKLEKTPILWLSTSKDHDEISINPTSISGIYTTITEFLEKAGKPVIFLEGVEHLIVKNQFQIVLNMLHSIYEKVSLGDGIVLVSLQKEAMSTQEWALITKDMEILSPLKL
jgi:hypothetical protein